MAPQPGAEVKRGSQGQQELISGLLWMGGGIAITVITYVADIPVYVVAWGPIVYGVIKVIRGVVNMARGR
ncbi:hypothetical protein [Dactylosporangium matsuzakiense]|uniref:hypothetical protein n=1 Tax=Dactylosporangium matsuzakiense TaxID=53360 RepID=UPI0021C386E5|nr:hypothetical protein [Dactylosporangium matsuzakiense]UWZ50236.1 hypothetical protein Dmats_46925 [Dactylosporangium matsuzakiense]